MHSHKEGRVYTPEYLTNYVAQISIEKFLLEKINSKNSIKIQNFSKLFEKYIPKKEENQISLDIPIDKADREQFEYIFELLRDLKVLDPAVGSGDLLVAALKVIEKLYFNLRRLGIINWSNNKIRKNILSNNLYGVDIEKNAIENAKRKLLFTPTDLVIDSKSKFLQNTVFNLRVGNSVIGYINQSEVVSSYCQNLNDCFYSEIKSVFYTHNYLKKSNLTQKQKKTMLSALKPFHWFCEFPEIMEKGGFDIIIENPPYIPNKYLSNLEKAIFQERFRTPKGLMNIFGIFIERSIDLCHPLSINCYIVHRNIIRSNNYDLLRKFLLQHTTIQEIVDIGAGAFPSITAETIVILVEKKPPSKGHKIQIITNFNIQNNQLFRKVSIKEIPQKVYLEQKNYNFNLNIQYDELEIINYIKKNKDCDLNNYFEAKTCIATGNDEEFLAHHKINNSFKKTLRGKNVGRFFIEFDGLYVNYNPKKLHRARNELIFQKPEKLIMQTISSNLTVAYDNNNYYPLSTCIAIIPKDDLDEKFSIKYLLLLLNSKLMNFYYDFVFNLGAHLTTEISVSNINQLPLKSPESYEIFNKLSDLVINVNKNETLREKNKKNIQFLEDLLDILIYEIFFFSKFQSDNLRNDLINKISWYLKDLKQNSMEMIDECIQNLQNDIDIKNEMRNIKKHSWIKTIDNYFKK